MPDLPLDSDRRLDFDELAELRDHLARLLSGASRSLVTFYVPRTGGFTHKIDPANPIEPSNWSRSSTATCIAFLRATGQLDEEPWGSQRAQLIGRIVRSSWKSAGLERDNPFTVAFLLEALADLEAGPRLTEKQRSRVDGKLDRLVAYVEDGEDAGVRLQDYDATAFLTYKVLAALGRWDRLEPVASGIAKWNWGHLYKESVLVASGSPDADVFEVAYSVLIASAVAPLDRMSPQQRSLLRYGLDQFFDAQRDDGTWPRGRPLFIYPKFGHAYCFDYELLAALLGDGQLRSLVYERLDSLRQAVKGLDERKYPLESARADGRSAYGWSSGHHGSDPKPESWSTAAALHFCFSLGDLVAEGIRKETFDYVGAPYEPPRSQAGPDTLPADFLDSTIPIDGRPRLKKQMSERFIKPLQEARSDLELGKPLPAKTPSSAIFYGPPGTSKTKLAKLLAKALGWPLLSLDPSHLTRHGLDNVHAEANKLFRMLQHCERIVVLLDEFDELVRDREDGELESRFLTTAMLPKLTALSEERRLVYLVATNHLERFDAAIRRPGRFDLVLPVMPPTLAAKRERWPRLAQALEMIEARYGAKRGREAREILSDLTFGEADVLARKLEGGTSGVDGVEEAFLAAGNGATLRQRVASSQEVDEEATWKEQMAAQSSRIRLGD